jgi:hypothetical protein
MNQPPVPPWKTLLERKTGEHYRCFHSGRPILTRRGFLSTGATGLLAASQFAFSPLALANQDKRRAKTTAEPNPIPGGGTAFGFHVHHNPLPNDPGLPLVSPSLRATVVGFSLVVANMVTASSWLGCWLPEAFERPPFLGLLDRSCLACDGCWLA